jgi:hypothetical protein
VPVIEVTEFATLAKLAERCGQLVMHWSRSDVETFVILGGRSVEPWKRGAPGWLMVDGGLDIGRDRRRPRRSAGSSPERAIISSSDWVGLDLPDADGCSGSTM